MNAKFGALLITRMASIGGAGIFFLAVAWILIHRGGGDADVAGIAVCLAVPGLFVTLHGGITIDRYDRRRIGQIAEIGRAIAVLGLAYLGMNNALHTWEIYVCTLIIGLGNAIALPCYGAMLPQLLGREKLISANSVWQIATQLGGIFASAFGGILVGAHGENAGLWAAVICYVIAAVTLQIIPRSVSVRSDPTSNAWQDLRAAYQVVSVNRQLRYVIVFSMIPPTALWVSNFMLPAFTNVEVGTGPSGFGLVEAVWGVGALLAGFAMPIVASHLGAGKRALAWSLYGISVSMLAFSLSRTLAVATILALFLGLCLSCAGIVFPAYVQEATPDGYLGRVLSGVQFGTSGLQLLIAGAVWAAGNRVSPGASFFGLAVVTLLGALGFQLVSRSRVSAEPAVHAR